MQMNKIIIWIQEHKVFSTYFLISVLVTILDITVSRFFERFFNEVEANTIGVISGFTVQYFLCAKSVYNNNSIRTAVIFFLTWLLGLAMADFIVYISRVVIFNNKQGFLYFIIGKGFSIVIPFFFLYVLRNRLISKIKKVCDNE